MVETIGSTFWPTTATLPSMRTRPVATSTSAWRRDATPAEAITFWIRSSGMRRSVARGVRGHVVLEWQQQRAALLGQARGDVGIEWRQVVEALEPEALEELEGG